LWREEVLPGLKNKEKLSTTGIWKYREKKWSYIWPVKGTLLCKRTDGGLYGTKKRQRGVPGVDRDPGMRIRFCKLLMLV